MTAKELPVGDWRRAVYGRSQIGGIGIRRRPRAVDRERIIAQQGYVCLYCEIPISTKIWRKTREVILCAAWDHFIPYAYSQQNPGHNWILACHVCNGIKTARMFNDVESARRAILPGRIAKGYECPDDVFHRLGLARDQDIRLALVPRPTDKQLEALQLLAAGASIFDAANQLGLARTTAHRRLLGAMRRLGAASFDEAIEIAIQNGFINRPANLGPDQRRGVMTTRNERGPGVVPGAQTGAQSLDLSSRGDPIPCPHCDGCPLIPPTHLTKHLQRHHPEVPMPTPTPAEYCGHLAPTFGLHGQPDGGTECVLRPGHTGSHADEHGKRWRPIAPAPAEARTADPLADPWLHPINVGAVHLEPEQPIHCGPPLNGIRMDPDDVRDPELQQLTERLAEARTALRIAEGDRDAAEGHARRLLAQRQEMADERYAWQERGDRAETAIARVRAVLDDPSALDWRLRIRDALDQPHPDQPASDR